MVSKPNSKEQRQIRHMRVRNKISGTAERPRLSVYRSLNNIYAQVIDDVAQNTIVSASTLDPELKGKLNGTGNKEAAKAVGEFNISDDDIKYGLLYGRSVIAEFLC